MGFVENVKAYCASMGISEADFERRCGIGKGSMTRWKGAEYAPTLKTLTKIQIKTGIPITRWLMEGGVSGERRPGRKEHPASNARARRA